MSRTPPTPPTPPGRAPLDTARLDEALGASTRARLGHVVAVERSGSTSSDLAEAVRTRPEDWPDRSVLLADHQEAGRGRRGRTWTTPRGTAVTMSVVLRPDVPQERWAWVPLLAGLAVAEAVAGATGARAGLKWPNDVVVRGAGREEVPGWGRDRKVAGVLGEVVATPAGRVAVVGVGVNVGQEPEELPVPWATSLALLGAGGGPSREELVGAALGAWVGLDEAWRAAGGDAEAAGLADRCAAACVTLGAQVRVELPGGRVVEGVARSLAPDGSLEVVDPGGAVRTVLAGDVHHVRAAR